MQTLVLTLSEYRKGPPLINLDVSVAHYNAELVAQLLAVCLKPKPKEAKMADKRIDDARDKLNEMQKSVARLQETLSSLEVIPGVHVVEPEEEAIPGTVVILAIDMDQVNQNLHIANLSLEIAEKCLSEIRIEADGDFQDNS